MAFAYETARAKIGGSPQKSAWSEDFDQAWADRALGDPKLKDSFGLTDYASLRDPETRRQLNRMMNREAGEPASAAEEIRTTGLASMAGGADETGAGASAKKFEKGQYGYQPLLASGKPYDLSLKPGQPGYRRLLAIQGGLDPKTGEPIGPGARFDPKSGEWDRRGMTGAASAGAASAGAAESTTKQPGGLKSPPSGPARESTSILAPGTLPQGEMWGDTTVPAAGGQLPARPGPWWPQYTTGVLVPSTQPGTASMQASALAGQRS